MNEPIIKTLLDIPEFCHWGESTTAMIKRMNERLAAHIADGICRLTKLQSYVFNHPDFWGEWTDSKTFVGKNIIIQAATTAGKTPVSEVAALDMREHGKKVIVLVPLKTMVKERYRQFKADIGGRVYASSSDYLDRDYELLHGEYDVAVMVYEKLFAMLCQEECHILDDCGLIIVDELSMLSANERGPKLEIALEKARQQSQPPRIICLTTLDCKTGYIENWLTPKGGEKAVTLRNEDRPVGLDETIVTLDGKCSTVHVPGEKEPQEVKPPQPGMPYPVPRIRQGEMQRRTLLTAEVLQRLYDENDHILPKTLLFVPSQLGTRRLAQELLKDAITKPLFPFRNLSVEFENDLSSCDGDEDHSRLRELLHHGIAFHHAGMSTNLRECIENHADEIDLIVATETLMIGVNLPFDCVILYTNQVYRSSGLEKLSRQSYRNFIGRAGRLGLAASGKSFLLVEADAAAEYRKKDGGENIVSAFVRENDDREMKIAPFYMTLVGGSFTTDDLKRLDDTSLSRSCGLHELDVQTLLDDLTTYKMAEATKGMALRPHYQVTKIGRALAPYALSLESACNLCTSFGAPMSKALEQNDASKFLRSITGAEDIRSDKYLPDILYIVCQDQELVQSHNLDIGIRKEKTKIQSSLLKALQELYDSGEVELWEHSALREDFLGDNPPLLDGSYTNLFRTLAMYYWVKGFTNQTIRERMHLQKFAGTDETAAALLSNGDLERFSEVLSFHIEAASRLPEIYWLHYERNAENGIPFARALYNLSMRVKYGMPTDMLLLANRQVHGLDRSQLLRLYHKAVKAGKAPIEYLFEAPAAELRQIMSHSITSELRRALDAFWRSDSMDKLLQNLADADVDEQWSQVLQDLSIDFALLGSKGKPGLRELLNSETRKGTTAFHNCGNLQHCPDAHCCRWEFYDNADQKQVLYIDYLPLETAKAAASINKLFPPAAKPVDCLLVTERGTEDLFDRIQNGQVPYFCRVCSPQTLALLLGSLVGFPGRAAELLYETLHDARGCLTTLKMKRLNYTMEPDGGKPVKYRILMDLEHEDAQEDQRLLAQLRGSQADGLDSYGLLPWGEALQKVDTGLPTVVLLDRSQIVSHESLYRFMYSQAHDLVPFSNCLVLLHGADEKHSWNAPDTSKSEKGELLWDPSFAKANLQVAETQQARITAIRRFLQEKATEKEQPFKVAISWAHCQDPEKQAITDTHAQNLIELFAGSLNEMLGEDAVLFDKNKRAGQLFHGTSENALKAYAKVQRVGIIFYNTYYCANNGWCLREMAALRKAGVPLFYVNLDGCPSLTDADGAAVVDEPFATVQDMNNLLTHIKEVL